MAQQLRTFTQRVTDQDNSVTKIFNVRAKTLVDQFGNDLVDSKGNKIWFPVTFEPADAIAYGKSLASKSTVTALFDLGRNLWQGGPWDLQRSYNGQSNAPFAEVFTPAASYVLGLIGAAAGFPQTALMAGGGVHNLLVNAKTAGLNFGNNPKNPPFIAQGFRDFFASPFAPPATIPNDSFRESSPADQFSTAFDHSFNGSSDNFNRLAASVASGNIIPTTGFADPRYGKLAPSPVSGSGDDQSQASVFDAGARPVRYLSSRIVSSSPDHQDPLGDRFGNWATSASGAEQPAPSQVDRPLGLFTGQPMPQWPVPLPLGGFPNRSGMQDSAGDDQVAQNSKRSAIPLFEEYIRYLNRANRT